MLVKVICKSRTYQLTSAPNEWNRHDKQAYARYYPKRLSAEVLLDAINLVTGTQDKFGPYPLGWRAVQVTERRTAKDWAAFIRWLVEEVSTSINTAAAGGNASLMTIG